MPCSNLLKPDLNLDTFYKSEVSRDDFAIGFFPPETWAVMGYCPTMKQG
jgi:hypothetical protein